MRAADLDAIWTHFPGFLAVTDPSGTILECNPAAENVGVRPGMTLAACVSETSADLLQHVLRDALDGHSSDASLLCTPPGAARTFALSTIPISVDRVGWSGRDITAERAHEVETRHALGRDPLTGLPDRATWRDRLEQALKRASRSGRGIGLMYVDLDEFKQVNDQYGHAFGDVVLIEAARRMRGVLRPADTLARLGGDEFIVLCEDLGDVGELQPLADRIARAVGHRPFTAHGRIAGVTCSVGVTYASASGMDIDTFIETADHAMYAAKRQGPGRVESERYEHRAERLVTQLQRAIRSGSLPMASHTVRDIADDSVVGHAIDVQLGDRPFVRSAFDTLEQDPENVGALARLAIGHAVETLRTEPSGFVQVRIPTAALADRTFLDSVYRSVRDAGADPERLVIAVASVGARSERMLLSAREAAGFDVSLALLRFGLHSIDLGALIALRPVICEMDPDVVGRDRPADRMQIEAACAVAHVVGARTQAVRRTDADDLRAVGVDQVRGLPGEVLQPLDRLPIEH